MEGKKRYFRHFLADQFVEEKKEKRFGVSYSTSNKLLLVARHIFDVASKNAFKVGSVKFADSLYVPFWSSIVKKVRTGSKSSQGT